jgi:hypothetical protein
MTETFLQFAWRFCLFTTADFRTSRGEIITIKNEGFLNTDAGPDFLFAKIQIGDTFWSGHVEIHIHASDWYKHNHHQDPAYDNVILHAVYYPDEEVISRSGAPIPMLDLSSCVDMSYLHSYENLLKQRDWIPCVSRIHQVDESLRNVWIERLLVQRIEEKREVLRNRLQLAKMDWTEMLYRTFARNFGFKVNAEAFEMLAICLPYKLLASHRDSQFQLEALLFGQAGMLEGLFSDSYPRVLQSEYLFLKKKYKLTGMSGSIWRYLRLMPANFPSLRIAQFAALLYHRPNLFADIREWVDPQEVFSALKVSAHEYWATHSGFDRKCKTRKIALGKPSVENIIINTVVPYIFLYANEIGTSDMSENGLALMQKCRPENNHIIRKWRKLGMTVPSAAQSQGYLELYNNYCSQLKCLNCAIGAEILRSPNKSAGIPSAQTAP